MPFINPSDILQYFSKRETMFETSGSYVLVKRFRRENAENSLALVSEPKEKVSNVKSQSPQRPKKPEKESKKEPIKKQDVRPHDKPVNDALFTAGRIYWLRTILYYIVFYAGLIILFYICFAIYEQTLPVDAPRVSKLQPSLVYHPNFESYFLNRISWNAFKAKDIKLIVNNINDFLEKFGTRREFGKCRANNSYGYKGRNPCVFLTVNRITGFQVDPIEDARELQRKERVLKKIINNLPPHKRKGRLWISCKSNSLVNIEYFPQSRSIPIDQINTKSSMDETKRNGSSYSESDYERIVTIQIQNVPHDKLFNVYCRMFAKNIENDDNERPWIGGVSFDMIFLTD
ncbi:sodium/potassium-transporting ATPase subunit beta-1 isoform X2 [Zeugodacus cucurbitae]|uniref:sodium/potassium-transporting ATPase subunit beta-1 isoform X1 n=1 Tax=Zeugodacus cucurbitae TaxID=28588 RepID=UPI0023D959B6|nr:sodium/potassium-transporting ATPase subunit beta-1 isoform X1 [Zeugodacus cucurbitae]XP_054084605.1 sodium/potassium-transporting ATPase subunit beta-1 isoform X2 [Zeugodacus cucurbitae]